MTVNKDFSFFATAPKGLESLLADELRELGANAIKQARGGIYFGGDLGIAMQACLWSRLANRVLLPLKRFEIENSDQLYSAVRTINWLDHFEPSSSFAIDATLSRAVIDHSKYAALKVKDAVVDQFREVCGERPSVERRRPDIRINLHVTGKKATISLDLSGESLHKRGYRVESMAAPLKENLAAAILLRAGWPAIAGEGGALYDPMCGSGTLLIEGAMIAADIAPGLLRDYFGFFGWKQFEPELWASLKKEAGLRREAGLKKLPPIAGSDRDIKTVGIARANIKAAGLTSHVTVQGLPLGRVSPAEEWNAGLLVCNPPYGERLGELKKLEPLYREIGTILQARFPQWKASVFTGNHDLALKIPLRSHKSYKLFNGAIECRLFNFEVKPERFFEGREGGAERDQASALKKALLPVEGEWGEGAQMLANRLRKNQKNLQRWAKREEVSCYRVYDADLPEYALAIDLYQGEKRWVHVQEYEAPKTVDREKAIQRLRDALAVIPELFDIPQQQLYLKVRKQQKGKAQYEKQGVAGGFYPIEEQGLKFLVNFKEYLDTGLFLDHRITRKMVGELANGKRFLNLFGYTGSATVYAAAGGAISTTTVDLSNTYLDWAQKNMELNRFRGEVHQFVRADCREWLKIETQGGNRYGLIFLDPPTFSNSKKMEGEFDVQRDHVELINNATDLLEEDGVLLFSTNFRRFRLDSDRLPGLEIEDISRKTLPKDYERNPKIHYCWKIRRSLSA